MRIRYKEINFRASSLDQITKINEIINEYQAQGYSLTLRQVFYQLVARDIIPNTERSYNNVGSLVSNGRLAGLIDWLAIEDRTRNLRANQHWDSTGSIIRAAAQTYLVDKWADQDYYIEVWVEKDALIGVVGQICGRLDVPYFSCRGYVSQSEMWVAAQRIHNHSNRQAVILHLGDHDPSGMDMSRDIVDRLNTFDANPVFRRIALNMPQIEEFLPPPNPTKLEDSRAPGYVEQFGYDCWELDALRPDVMSSLIEHAVLEYRDQDRFEKALEREREARRTLSNVSDHWGEIEGFYK
ncbi:hypothetical protein ABEW34_21440 [Paenibacillus algorifonticola]|uniref:hypothetical protein n=1 Tax=Paenibacillus algorifonticola TaxID=684063 RepID=UPI003D26EB03